MNEAQIQQEFQASPEGQIHGSAEVVNEDERLAVHCDPCGAQFTVSLSTNGCVFDQVAEGDGSCLAEHHEPYCEPEADSGNPHLGEDEDIGHDD
jgi:hypothetical protein